MKWHFIVAGMVAAACGGSKPAEAPGRSYAGECMTEKRQDATLVGHPHSGWSIVVPGAGWETDCSNPEAATAKLESTLGELLMLNMTRTDDAPADPDAHFQAIYARAIEASGKLGATVDEPRFVLASSEPGSPEKTVMVYQVHADQFERAGVRNIHGWALLDTNDGATYECHLSAMVKKAGDFSAVLARYLSTCQPLEE
jgi:hypothetical protein